MCRCVTSKNLLARINEKREKKGLATVTYSWLMVQARNLPFLRPVRIIGRNYIWDRRTASLIVDILCMAPFNPKPFRYEKWYRDNPKMAKNVIKFGGINAKIARKAIA